MEVEQNNDSKCVEYQKAMNLIFTYAHINNDPKLICAYSDISRYVNYLEKGRDKWSLTNSSDKHENSLV